MTERPPRGSEPSIGGRSGRLTKRIRGVLDAAGSGTAKSGRRAAARASVLAFAMGSVLSACAADRAAPPPDPWRGLLAAVGADGTPAAQRARMASRIRRDVEEADPAAATPAFGRALAVVAAVPRERFVRRNGRRMAYVDLPQDIGHGQTISDPFIVTVMTAALELPADRSANVLDVGTGSGYQAAVLSPLVRRVSSIEIVPELAKAARTRLRSMGYRNVAVRTGDGFAGWPERAPFDGIVVAAGAAEVPRPLVDQLKVGGRLVMPIGPNAPAELLLVITKRADGTVSRCSLGPAMFVPLTGRGMSVERPGLIDRSVPLCGGGPVAANYLP